MNRQKLIEWPDCNADHCAPESACRIARCCSACVKGRRNFYEKGGLCSFSKDEKALVRSLWNEGSGFWQGGGCSLPRRLRPTECLKYDCKDYVFFSEIRYGEKGWYVNSQKEVPAKKVTKKFHSKYWDMLKNA